MEVRILEATKDPIKSISVAAGTCYDKPDIDIYFMPERPDISRKLDEALSNNLKKAMMYYGN